MRRILEELLDSDLRHCPHPGRAAAYAGAEAWMGQVSRSIAIHRSATPVSLLPCRMPGFDRYVEGILRRYVVRMGYRFVDVPRVGEFMEWDDIVPLTLAEGPDA